MANLLSRAIRQHTAVLKRTAGIEVVYIRDGVDKKIDVVALGADIESDSIESDYYTEKRRDFGIDATELVFDSQNVEPKEGDEIRYAGRSFLVAPTTGERCFESMDQFGVLLRVRTVAKGAAVE